MSSHMVRAREVRVEVLDLLSRFPAMSRSHVADVLFRGNPRAANRVLLSLARAGRVFRFPLTPRGEYVYSLRKRPSSHLEHHLTIAGLYASLVKGALGDCSVTGAANVELQKGLVCDLLAVAGDLVLLTEVHLGSNSFGCKLGRYYDFRTSGQWEQAPWWQPGVEVVVWLVATPTAVGRLEQLAGPYRAVGMRVVVSSVSEALADAWAALGYSHGRGHHPGSTGQRIRWRLPEREGAGGRSLS